MGIIPIKMSKFMFPIIKSIEDNTIDNSKIFFPIFNVDQFTTYKMIHSVFRLFGRTKD